MNGAYLVHLDYIIGAFMFIAGCCIGSFLNVCICRIPRGQSVTKPRGSICPECKSVIRGYDNIPLLSYILLLGRCRRCGNKISFRYPLVEAATGLLFLAIYLAQGVNGGMGADELIIMCLLLSLLIVASGIDMEFLIIPDEVTVFGLLGGLAAGLLLPHMHAGHSPWHTFATVSHINGLAASSIGALAGGGIVAFFAAAGALIFRREAIGIGDVKLMAMAGAFTGWRLALAAFALAPIMGLLYGLPLLLIRRRRAMPFGPFLAAATILCVMFRGDVATFLNRYIDTLFM